MKRVHPETAYEYWHAFKVQKICKRDTYKPRTFSEPVYAVMVDIHYPKYDLDGWTYIWLGTNDGEPTTYDTEEEAIQFMKWIADWCDAKNKTEDVYSYDVTDFEE